MPLTLHLRADDAGLSLGTNAAIEAATLTCPNISLMAVCPAIEDAADRFRHRSGLCLGLHFTLNAEWKTVRWRPLSPPDRVPSLIAPDGLCYPNPWQLPPGVVYQPAHVEIELQAQLDRLRSLGLTIKYLDSHMAVLRTKPELEETARRFAAREGLIYLDNMPTLKHGPYSDSLDANLSRWAALLDAPPAPGSIAIFHPSQADGVMETLTEDASMLPTRDAERALLASPRFAALLREKDVRVLPFLNP
jgi:predicted glycoside hydrolase/deacetylase ChbG (UPF0249 family)